MGLWLWGFFPRLTENAMGEPVKSDLGLQQRGKLVAPLEKTSGLQPAHRPPPAAGRVHAVSTGADAVGNAPCQRRRRDFHASYVHSSWAGSCFVFNRTSC